MVKSVDTTVASSGLEGVYAAEKALDCALYLVKDRATAFMDF